MIKKLLSVSVLLSLIASGWAGASTKTDIDGLKKTGAYAAVEVSTGAVLDKEAGLARPDYAMKLAAGYRICPQFIIAAGFEGVNSVKTGTTSVPVFLQLRSDFLDRKVSPFVQMEFGYAFQIPQGNMDASSIKLNDEIVDENLNGMSLDEYLSQFPDEDSKTAATNGLKRFSNGSKEYLDMDKWNDRVFSKDGFFANITLGASFRFTGESRSNIFLGIVGGISGYNEGLYVRTLENKLKRFGKFDQANASSDPVIIEGGQAGFGSKYKGELRFKIGYSF